MKKRVLLIEPDYKNKYPPIALMKLSTYHKERKDTVVFCKGKTPKLRAQKWDRIYITTVFTFHWNQVVDTIKYYLNSVDNPKKIYVGGSMASVMEKELLEHEGFGNITILHGLLDIPGQLDKKSPVIIDELIPDYDIIDAEKNKFLSYEYKVKDAFFVHSTRGCVRNCDFCAVPIIEPCFKKYFDIKPKINAIREKYGDKKDLLMMDNNVLASVDFSKIVDDIIKCGYGRDNNNFQYVTNGIIRSKKRYVDFNQGVDARIIHMRPEIMKEFGRIAIRPLRIAFDHADEDFVKIYVYCMELAAENEIKELSNYILYNYEDTPDELYSRLEINTALNERFVREQKVTRIWSFPMRYSPLKGEHAKDRKYVGAAWTRKQIRGVQCILNATHGVVGPKRDFFNRAFGASVEEFNLILWMPERLIINRDECEKTGETRRWKKLFLRLDETELMEFKKLIAPNVFTDIGSKNCRVNELLSFYHGQNN